MLGTPPGTWVKSGRVFSASVQGQWSVLTTCSVSLASACHSASWSSKLRSGGAQM